MIKIAFLALLLATSALAQQPAPNPLEQALKAQLGEYVFNNTILLTENKRLNEENTKLKKELEDAKQNAKASPSDGSSRP